MKFNLKMILILLFTLFIVLSLQMVFAEEPVVDGDENPVVEQPMEDGEDEKPAFVNATQAQRAINVAEEYAEKKASELEKAEEEAANAQQAVDDAGDDVPQELLDDLEAANQKVTDLMTEQGVSVEDITAMRLEGMGWGEIMHQLGLHPSILGMGHKNAFKNKKWNGEIPEEEIREATQRNFNNGLSKGHGPKADKENYGQSKKDTNTNAGKKKGKGNNGKAKGKDK